tara:strand:- start:19 stop:621 length:603 start_codon:yes stop_codon:yes gene_type:complete
MKNTFDVLPLFSSPLAMTIIDEDTEELNTYENSGIEKSNKSRRILKKYPKIENILLKKFKEYSENVLKYNNNYKITTSWITNIEEGKDSTEHFHKNSLYSGVYYFQDNYPKGCASIEFFSPIVQLSDFWILPKDSDCEIMNSHTWFIKPQPKLLLFFPSYLRHKINIHKNNKIRRSLAFNIIPIGEYGSGDSSYNTSWII